MSEISIQTFEELEAWRSGRQLRMYVFQTICPILKEAKEFSLSDQIKRSSRSVTHNIAEGHGRFHHLDNYRFCSQARGSLYEVLDQLITSHDDQLITEADYQTGRKHFDTTVKLLNGYMSWLKKTAADKSAPAKASSSS